MNDRISIKGQGKSLFFGDREDPAPDDSKRQHFAKDGEDARQTDSKLAGQTDSKTARKTESKTVRQTDTSPREHWPAEALRRLRESLYEEHPVHNTFRYAPSDLDAVRDILYELEVKRAIKTTRNHIMRLGLAWIVDDYRANGANSLLVAVLKEEKWQRGR